MVACPKSSCTSLGWVPCESNKVARVCRRSWKDMFGRPARLSRGLKERLRRLEGLMRVPASVAKMRLLGW
jgi:hypothetical protein